MWCGVVCTKMRAKMRWGGKGKYKQLQNSDWNVCCSAIRQLCFLIPFELMRPRFDFMFPLLAINEQYLQQWRMVNIFLGKSITDFAFAEGIYTTGYSTTESTWTGLVGVQTFQLLHGLTSRKVNIILVLANTDTANWPFLWAIAGVFGTTCNMFLSHRLRSSSVCCRTAVVQGQQYLLWAACLWATCTLQYLKDWTSGWRQWLCVWQ